MVINYGICVVCGFFFLYLKLKICIFNFEICIGIWNSLDCLFYLVLIDDLVRRLMLKIWVFSYSFIYCFLWYVFFFDVCLNIRLVKMFIVFDFLGLICFFLVLFVNFLVFLVFVCFIEIIYYFMEMSFEGNFVI